MTYRPLGDTLLALVSAVRPPEGSGLVVTEAEMTVPLEVFSGREQGDLVFYASVPHTLWKSGVLPPVHTGVLKVVLTEDDDWTDI